MSTRRLIGYIVLVLFVILILTGAGYSLFRWGYAEGIEAASSAPFEGHHMGGMPYRSFPFGWGMRMQEGFYPSHARLSLLPALGILFLAALVTAGSVALIRWIWTGRDKQPETRPGQPDPTSE